MPDDYDPQAEARDNRFNELMDVRRDRHGRIIESGTNLLRARSQLIREEIATQRFDLQHQRLDLDRVIALGNILKQKALIQQQIQAQTHVVSAMDRLKSLDPRHPNFNVQFAEVFRDNPMATKDPMVQKFSAGLIDTLKSFNQSNDHIRQVEETQGAEYGRLHGINAVWKDGRIDWTASQKLADDAAKAKRDAAQADAVLTGLPLTKVVTADGKITETREAAKASNKLNEAAAAVSELQTRAKKTQEYLDGEKVPAQQAKLKASLNEINTQLEEATMHHDAMKKAFGAPPAAPAAVTGAPAAPGTPAPSIKMKFDSATGDLVPVQ